MAQLNGIVRGNINDIATKETIRSDTAYNFQDIQGISLTNEQMTNALTTAQNGFFKKDSIWYCTDSGTYQKDHFYQFTITGTSPVDNVASWTDLGALGGGSGPETYIKSASVSGNTLTLVDQDDAETQFTSSVPIVTQNVEIQAADWDAVTGIDGYSYSADITVQGAEAGDVSIVTFNIADADSGNFASVCDTDDGFVTIYAKQAQDVTIPTVLTIKTGVQPVPPPVPTADPGLYTDSTYTTFATLPEGTAYAGQDATWENIKLAYPDAFATTGTITGDAENNSSYFPDTLVGDLVISDEIISIVDWAFSYCSGLTSVTIPNSVTSIGSDAFGGCEGLTSVTIPNSVISIGDEAFFSCWGLTSLTIPNSVTTIGTSAFDGCNGLTGTLTIPNSVTSIEERVFYGCDKLNSVTIGSGVTSIRNEAFSDCYGLTSITIPASVTSIEGAAFQYCSSLTTLIVNANYNNTTNSNTLISGQNYGYGQDPNIIDTPDYNDVTWEKVS